jgi:hypothetical protein
MREIREVRHADERGCAGPAAGEPPIWFLLTLILGVAMPLLDLEPDGKYFN